MLPSVLKIEKIEDHPNADHLQIIYFEDSLGCVEKNKFKIGDLAIYIPKGYVIPKEIVEKYDIKYLKGQNKNVIKNIKIRGIKFDGIVIPNIENLVQGEDVTSLFKLKKYNVEKKKEDIFIINF